MNSKNLKIMAAFMGLAFMGQNSNQGRSFEPSDLPDKKKPIPAGCKEYSFYGYTVTAINESSARKKCKRLAGIK